MAAFMYTGIFQPGPISISTPLQNDRCWSANTLRVGALRTKIKWSLTCYMFVVPEPDRCEARTLVFDVHTPSTQPVSSIAN